MDGSVLVKCMLWSPVCFRDRPLRPDRRYELYPGARPLIPPPLATVPRAPHSTDPSGVASAKASGTANCDPPPGTPGVAGKRRRRWSQRQRRRLRVPFTGPGRPPAEQLDDGHGDAPGSQERGPGDTAGMPAEPSATAPAREQRSRGGQQKAHQVTHSRVHRAERVRSRPAGAPQRPTGERPLAPWPSCEEEGPGRPVPATPPSRLPWRPPPQSPAA